MFVTRLNDPVQLSADERPLAARLGERLSAPTKGRAKTGSTCVLLPDGEKLEVPADLLTLFAEIASTLARGEPVSILPLQRELTTQEAADILNMSRQHLVTLLDAGKIPFSRPRSHRRIRAADLLAYKKQRDAERREILREMTADAQQDGSYFGD